MLAGLFPSISAATDELSRGKIADVYALEMLDRMNKFMLRHPKIQQEFLDEDEAGVR
jgi:hypothetical protein